MSSLGCNKRRCGWTGPTFPADREPAQKYDPERDRIFVFSAGDYAPFGYLLLVNGHPEPDPVELHTSTRYRLRLINITDGAADLRVRLATRACRCSGR